MEKRKKFDQKKGGENGQRQPEILWRHPGTPPEMQEDMDLILKVMVT